MKKMLLIGSMSAALFVLNACGNNQPAENTHTHEDGSTHADHDTTKPNQQEFKVGDTTHADTSGKPHTHADGEQHTH
jgi:hypothetical protein